MEFIDTTRGATQSALPELRARLASLKAEGQAASDGARAAQLRLIQDASDPKALKDATEARNRFEVLTDAVAELERQVLHAERQAVEEQHAAKDKQVLAGVARAARQEATDEQKLFALVADIFGHVEAQLGQAVDLFYASAARQDATMLAARELRGPLPAFIATEEGEVSTAKLTQIGREGALLAAFEQGDNAAVYGPALRGLLNDVIYRRQWERQKMARAARR